MKAFIYVLSALCLLWADLALALDTDRGIEVTGKASVSVQPDKFSLTIRIKERGRSATKTKALVDHKSEQISKMFLKQGIEPADIDSSQITMYPIYEKPSIIIEPAEIKHKINNTDKVTLSASRPQHEPHVVVSFDVARTITITFTEWHIYDQVLDQVVKLGVSHISPMEMSFQQPEKYYQQALMLAIANAREKAQAIAKQAGVSLGQLNSLKETSHFAPASYRMMSEASAGFNSTTTKKAVSAQVIVNYQLQP